MAKLRLDLLLVEQGLADSRSKAQGLIMAGLIYRGEQKLDKAGLELPDDTELTVRGKEHPWVSRGGMKLAHAIAEFSMDVKGAVALDVGSSTGGFTDVLLTLGAAKVFAVDVGTGQLDVKLRNDPRVVVMEQTNARHLTAEIIAQAGKVHNAAALNSSGAAGAPLPAGEAAFLPRHIECGGVRKSGEGDSPPADSRPHPEFSQEKIQTSPVGRGVPAAPPEQTLSFAPVFDIIVCDASFISLKKVLPAALKLAKPHAQLVALIKPQFEVGKAEVSRGKGVIRDAALHQAVCADIQAWIAGEGWSVIGVATSPITGPKGNVEFLLYARKL